MLLLNSGKVIPLSKAGVVGCLTTECLEFHWRHTWNALVFLLQGRSVSLGFVDLESNKTFKIFVDDTVPMVTFGNGAQN